MVQKANRDPHRKIHNHHDFEKMEEKLKGLVHTEMRKVLINKTWDITNPDQDASALVLNLLEKLLYKFEEYYFSVNCLLKNDDAGFTAYSNSFFFFPKEDSTCFEVFKNDDEKILNSLFCTVYISYFKFK